MVLTIGLPCLLIYLSLGYAWRVFAFVFCSCFYFFPSPPIRSREAFSSVIFSSLSLLLFVFFLCSDGMEREACVCDHGLERWDLCAEIIIIIIIICHGVDVGMQKMWISGIGETHEYAPDRKYETL